jgi:hypothetical protein
VRLLAAFVAALGALAVSGCGQDDGGSAAESRANPGRVFARSAHIGRGRADVRLLALPGVGRLLVSCDDAGRWSTAFRAGRRAASADVIVERGTQVVNREIDPEERWAPSLESATSGVEHWRIAEFAKAQAAVTTITVAARPIGADEARQCAISADATTFASDAGTLTR